MISIFQLLLQSEIVMAKKMTLYEAVNEYVYNTSYVKVQRLVFDTKLLEYDNFKKSLLPSFSFSFTPISFNHSMRLLQNFITGEYSNVDEFTNTTFGGFSVMQKVSLTGGAFTLGSDLSFLHEFANNNNSFSTTPLYLSYSQSLFGGGKSMKYEKEISELEKSIAMKEFCMAISTEQQKILALYLDAISNKMEIDFYTRNVSMCDSLLVYAQMRRDMGKITEYEYNMVELQLLDSKITLEKFQYAYISSIKSLQNELQIDNVELEQLSVIDFPLKIDENLVMECVGRNNPKYQSWRLKSLNAEYAMHLAKVNNRFNSNISLSFGINQYANTLREAYKHPNQRQAMTVTFNIPVFQWGVNRNKIKIAQNEFETVQLDQEREIVEFKEEIHANVVDYNMCRQVMDVVSRKYELLGKQYDFAVMRFSLGKMDVIELSEVHKDFLQAKQDYLSVLNELLINYYKIRHLSLYDFIENQDLMEMMKKQW